MLAGSGGRRLAALFFIAAFFVEDFAAERFFVVFLVVNAFFVVAFFVENFAVARLLTDPWPAGLASPDARVPPLTAGSGSAAYRRPRRSSR